MVDRINSTGLVCKTQEPLLMIFLWSYVILGGSSSSSAYTTNLGKYCKQLIIITIKQDYTHKMIMR